MSTYHYTECGLLNVFIKGIVPVIDDDGDEVITVELINVLHNAIAEGIVNHEKGISGGELRFLRAEMGLTQAELSAFVHADKQTIGRWERNESSIDQTSETVLRRVAIERLLIPFSDGIERLAKSSVPTAQAQPINIQATETGYELVAA